MGGSWEDWRDKAGYPNESRENPEASIFTGACYMGWLIGQWKSPRPAMDRYLLASASYNAGIGRILAAQDESGGKLLYSEIIDKLPITNPSGSKETTDYGSMIMTYYSLMVTQGDL